MSKGNAEVLAKLDQLTTLVREGFKAVDVELRAVQAEQRRHAEAIAELRGEMRGLSSWLSSMDQRFVAIMRPYEPQARQATPPTAAE